MQGTALVSPRPGRNVLKLSLGISLAMFVAVIAGLVLWGGSAEAASVCTLSNTIGPPTPWSRVASWSCVPASTYPGANPGDTAVVALGNAPLSVDVVVPNSVILQLTAFASPITIPAGSALTLEPSSTITSSDAINVGGTLTITNSAPGTLTSQSPVNLNGGTLNLNGSLAFLGANFAFNGGTINGPGTVTNPAFTTCPFSGTNGAMIITNGAIVDNFGTINFTSSGQSLSINNGGQVTVESGAFFNLVQNDPINSNGGGSKIRIKSGGTLAKSGGLSNVIAADVDNDGTVSLPSTGLSLTLAGGGTHTGAFQLGIGGTLTLNGAHTFNAGSSFGGTGNVTISGGTFQANTVLTIPGNLVNNGSLGFGPGPTTQGLAVSGNYVQGATGGLTTKINGPTAGSNYDQIRATGTATIAGSLNAPLGFPAAAGQTFDIVTDSSVSGDFSSSVLGSNGGVVLQEIPQPPTGTQVRLQAVAIADINIVKTGPASVLDGQNATFTITVQNLGPSTATNVVVTDTFSGATFVSAAASGGGTCSGTTSPFTCTWASIANGATQTATVVLKAGLAPGPINNTATATLNELDPTTPNTSSAAVNINPVADVSIGPISASTNPVNAGQSDTWTVPINNIGPDPAPGSSISITLSGGSVTSFTAPAGYTCTNGTTTVSCVNATIALGPATITVTANAPAQGGPWTMTGAISPSVNDPVPGNNSATRTVTVTSVADLQLTKTLLPPGLIAGSSATYNVTVTNLGPSDAANVIISDVVPPPLTLLSITDSMAVCPTLPCTLPTLAAGASETISATYSLPSNASGTVTNNASVTTTTSDPNLANNTVNQTNTIVQKAVLAVTKSGPSIAVVGSKITFTIKVTNNGPSDAVNTTLADPTPSRLSFVSATAPCTGGFASPCALGTLTPTQSKIIQVTYTVLAGTATITNTATANSSTSPSPVSASASLTTGCPTTPTNQLPADGATGLQTTTRLQWTDAGAASYNVYFGPAGTGCTTLFTTTRSTTVSVSNLQGGTIYEWRVEGVTPGCPTKSSTCTKFTTTGANPGCPTAPPTLISPLNMTVTGQTTFTWSSVTGARDYQLIVNGKVLTTTTSTSYGPVSIDNGPVVWSVVAEFDPPCTSLTSTNGSYNACDTSSSKPVPSIIAQADSGQSYLFLWETVNGATKYEADESNDPNFGTVTTLTTTTTSLSFNHPVTTPTAFYYRVRAFIGCANAFGPNSDSVRIVLAPVTAPSNPNVSAPAGSDTLIPIIVHINGFPDGTFPFTASTDPQQPWLIKVQPSSGLLPPDGIDLTVFANPTGLPNGTHTGTVIVLVTTPASKSGPIVANGVTPVNAPVSISLVTPVTPKPSGPPPANALIIPSTGHLDGINSRWASDVRILNNAAVSVHYQLTFTPDDISKGVKQTVVQVDGGATMALDDVVKTWYGVGSLGESSNGSLEIRPLDNPAKSGSDDAPSISFTTVASSRTYNAAPNSAAGTLGEYIPAIAFQNFVGKAIDSTHAATILSLQQVAQNDAMRTNFGLMEASGQPASVMVSVYNSAGQRLLQTPITLLGGQHSQLNGFLAQNKISLPDGRIEVQVVGGDGKITAYASVIDNKSGDPILISGVPLGQKSADRFVLPGVADLNTGAAAWRTDMRIFNPTAAVQNVTMTFYPVNGTGQPATTSMGINPGEVKQLDNTLQSVFGLTNIGGAIHVVTATAVPLVVSGRTYNLTSNGTFGQLTTGVTAADAIGKGDKPLQILQTESSVRQRTNVGMFEVTGKPATVEVTVFLPDSKVAPSTQIPLAANGFIQIPVIQSLGLSNVYNARVMMRVVDGDGKIGAYGSVIDQVTQDATYVPAQQ